MSEVKVEVGTERERLTLINQEAFALLAPKPVVISGNIDAPREYFSKRKETIAHLKQSTHVLVDLANHTIQLIVDEENPYNSHRITGKLLLNPDLIALEINKEIYRTKNEMVNKIRPIKHFFTTPSRHADLLMTFQKFTGKIEKSFEDSNDQQGKKKKLEEYSTNWTTYNSDGSRDEKFNNVFGLSLPLFLGFPKVAFDVELCLEPTDYNLKFYLQSIDLYEKIENEKEKAMNEAVADFKEYCPVIYV
jgi:hypothetical protein